MSLHIAAQHLASKGRGPDTTLVHMTEGEVKSLQDIAKAHGGSLTINPSTGLPEAGFLSSILPMMAGAGLMMIPGMQPLGAAALVGGGSLLLNPNAGLKGGIMAGLGAYGGAGLGEALAQQGMQQASAAELAKSQAGISNVVGDAATKGIPENITQDQYVKNVLAQTQPYVDARTAAQTAFDTGTFSDKLGTMGQGIQSLGQPGGFSNLVQNLGGTTGAIRTGLAVAAPIADQQQAKIPEATPDRDMGQRYAYNANRAQPLPAPNTPGYQNMGNNFGAEQSYFIPSYTKISNDQAKSMYGYAGGGPVEQMSNNAAIGANTMYPMASTRTSAFSSPFQDPIATNMLSQVGDDKVNPMTGESSMQGTRLAEGGISDAHHNLGGYSDGGRLLRGPGDGVSDSIPATIGNKQPARLADGEFVVPARIVSELGNGSTEAGARKLYAMMDRVQNTRSKTVGKGNIAKNSRADKHLPA